MAVTGERRAYARQSAAMALKRLFSTMFRRTVLGSSSASKQRPEASRRLLLIAIKHNYTNAHREQDVTRQEQQQQADK